VARLIARFPLIADRIAAGSVSIRALVELREVLTEHNQVEVLLRAEGKSQEGAQVLAVEYRPKPIPRDVVRGLPMPPAQPVEVGVVPAGTEPPAPPAAFALVPVETNRPSSPHEVVKAAHAGAPPPQRHGLGRVHGRVGAGTRRALSPMP
jgi:hypothetical protein